VWNEEIERPTERVTWAQKAFRRTDMNYVKKYIPIVVAMVSLSAILVTCPSRAEQVEPAEKPACPFADKEMNGSVSLKLVQLVCLKAESRVKALSLRRAVELRGDGLWTGTRPARF